MLKFVFVIILTGLFASYAHAFTLTVNSGKDDGRSYYIVHLEDDKPINCKTRFQRSQKVYTCYVPGKMTEDIADQRLPFMQLLFRKAENRGYYVIVVPRMSSEIYNMDTQLYSSQTVALSQSSSSRHYTIVIDEKLLQLRDKDGGLDFPVIFPDLLTPSIGALDFDKRPIEIVRNGDVEIYMNIKRSYDQGAYAETVKRIRDALKISENSVFKKEFMLYLMRSLDKLAHMSEDYRETDSMAQEIIDLANAWTHEFTSDLDYTEVYYYAIRANLLKEQEGEASYLLDILMTEHSGDPWTSRAILSYADTVLANGKIDNARRFYTDVFYSARSLDVASEAALKLASSFIAEKRVSEAITYVQKVIDANPKFFLQEPYKSLELANALRREGFSTQANAICAQILNGTNKSVMAYEQALRALALATAGQDANKTYDYLKRYVREFPTSEHRPLIDQATDRLFFSLDGANPLNRHETYLNLMDKYKGGDIGEKALAEEIKLSYAEKDYARVLGYHKLIMDRNDTELVNIFYNSALNLANIANQAGDCLTAIRLVRDYDLEGNITDPFKLYNCYVRMSKFEEALALAAPRVKTNDLHDRVEWLSNASRALFQLGRYEECVKACDDSLALAVSLPSADPTEALFWRFYSLLYLNRFDEALLSIKALEDLRGTDNKLVEAYNAAAKYAAAHGHDSVAMNYAQKAVEMQKVLKIHTFSPEIDFVYFDSLVKLGKSEEAFSVGKEILASQITNEQRARALYGVAELYIKKGDFWQAKNYVNDCIKTDAKTPWTNLCKEQAIMLEKMK